MRRVLILEQEAFLGALLSERFERSGFNVTLVPDTFPGPHPGPYAPDLIIVGTHDPGTLRHLYRWVAATPVIVLGEPREALPAWLFPTPDKPFSPKQLVELASRYLVAQKLHQGAAERNDLGTVPIS